MNNSFKGLMVIFLALSMIPYGFHFQEALANNSSPQPTLLATNKVSQSSSFITINGNSQLAQRSNSGSGTESDPYILSNYGITCSGTQIGGTSGITIENTTKIFILEQMNVQNCDRGIRFDHVRNGIILNSLTVKNSVGIELMNGSSYNSVVVCNSSANVYFGINIWGQSLFNKIENNIFSNNGGGGAIDSDNTTVSGNIFSYNDLGGLSIISSSGSYYKNNVTNNVVGLYVTRNNNNFSNNTVNYNKEDAFNVVDTSFSTFQFNTIEYNNYGFYIDSSLNNSFRGNIFSNNKQNIFENNSANNVFANNIMISSNQDVPLYFGITISSIGVIITIVELRRYARKKRTLAKNEKISFASFLKNDFPKFFKKDSQKNRLSKETFDLLEEIENENKL